MTTETVNLIRTIDEIAQRLRDIGYEVDNNRNGYPITVRIRSDRCGEICHSPHDGLYGVFITYTDDHSIHQVGRKNRLYNDCLKNNMPVNEVKLFCAEDMGSVKEVFKRLDKLEGKK